MEILTNTGALNVQSFTLTPSLPGTVQTANTDLGGEGVGYHSVSINPTELYYSSAGSWSQYTVNVSQSGTYSLAATVRTGIDNEAFSLSFDGTASTGNILVPNTGWNTYGSITVPGVNLTAGQHVIRINSPSGGFFMKTLTFTR